MTVTEIAKRFDLQPKNIIAFVQANATFPIKRNFQTGEITIPDNVDIANFIAPLLGKAYTEKQQKIAKVVESKIEQERLARCQSEQEHIFAIEKLKKQVWKVTTSTKSLAFWILVVYLAAIRVASILKL